MDVLQLIGSVRKHVYLYDINHKMYKNVGLKNWAWDSIAEEMNQTSEAVRLKWKTVRDGYIKYKKQLKNAASSRSFTKVPDYIWCDHLQFLDYHQVSRRSTKAFSKAKRKTYTTVDPQTSSSPIEVNVMPSLQTMPSSSTNYLFVEPVQQHIQTPKHGNEDETEQTIKKIKTLNHDAIDYLFLSYAQTFKKFTLRQQAVMKMELAKMFSRAELAELDTSEFESANSFSFVKSVIGAEGMISEASPAQSNPSSSCSNSEQNPIKEEQEENALPEDFQGHIVL